MHFYLLGLIVHSKLALLRFEYTYDIVFRVLGFGVRVMGQVGCPVGGARKELTLLPPTQDPPCFSGPPSELAID